MDTQKTIYALAVFTFVSYTINTHVKDKIMNDIVKDTLKYILLNNI